MRRKHKVRGEVYAKMPRPEFRPLRSPESFRRSETQVYASVPVSKGDGLCVREERQSYTGTYVKGIATMHKSNAVPVIDEEQATDIARMRRS